MVGLTLLVLVTVILAIVVHRTDGGCCVRRPIRSTGPLAKMVTSFTETDILGSPTRDLRYVFILTKHGMVAPVDKADTYPGDNLYKTKWYEGRFTTNGRRLMTRLGRSLATRYKSYLAGASLQNIKVTTMDTEYGAENAEELLTGLLPGQPHPTIFRTDEDQFSPLKLTSACPAYANLRYEVLRDSSIAPEVRSLFEYLKSNVGNRRDWDNKWDINLFEKLYNLWEIFDFEFVSHDSLPRWCDESRQKNMLELVEKYVGLCVKGDDHMAKFVVGLLIQEIVKEMREQTLKMHIHVTSDFTYAAIKGILLGGAAEVPEFGETLMVEVDSTRAIRVFTYRPFLEKDNFQQKGFEVDDNVMGLSDLENTLFNTYGISNDFHEGTWVQLCSVQ